jgi:predicted ATP-grasp superfamily ATP-dependent carboligase
MIILVLDAETNQALATVRSLGRAGYDVVVASRWRRPLAAWSRHCRASHRVESLSVAGFSGLRQWARARNVEIVLPLTERSCVLVNEERDQWEAAGIVVGCAPTPLLEIAFDKQQTIECASKAGIRTPPGLLPNALSQYHNAAAQLGFPCVIKSRFSHAWDGISFHPAKSPAYVYDADTLEAAVLDRRQGAHWPLVQGYVSGQGKGVFALCDHGRVVAWGAHERLRDVQPTGSGSSLRRSIAVDGRLREPAALFLEAAKWHGPAMVEFRDDGVSRPCLIEVNGRFWNSLQLMIDAGIDFPKLWVELLQGRSLGTAAAYAEGITLRWLWGDVKRLLHIAAGPPRGYRGKYPSVWQGLQELFGTQPPGTRLEVWQRADPWPAVGEWVQGVNEVVSSRRRAA